MRVRAARPISSSLGHEWTKAGQILDIPAEDAAELVRIAPDEFEVVDDEPVTEPDPGAEDSGESKKPAARGGRRTRVTED